MAWKRTQLSPTLTQKSCTSYFGQNCSYFGISYEKTKQTLISKTYSNGIFHGHNQRNYLFENETVRSLTQGVTQRKKPPAPSPFLFFGVIEPFCEAILCNKGFKSLGGHAIFDTTIVLNSIMMALASPQAAGSADKKLR